MPRFAFSTVACPEMRLAEVAELAETLDFDAVDLYTEGARATRFACDPAMSDETKTRAAFRTAGVEVGVLTTGIRYDEPVFPPVVGRATNDLEASIRQTADAVLLAQKLGCRLIRVLGFEAPSRTSLGSTTKLITSRLNTAATAARGTGVKIALENGGSYATGQELARLLDRIENPDVVASYSIATAHAAGELAEDGLRALGDHIAMVRVSDLADGRPAAFGDGKMPNADVLSELARNHWQGLITFDYPRAWFDDLGNLDEAKAVLATSVERMHHAFHGSPTATH